MRWILEIPPLRPGSRLPTLQLQHARRQARLAVITNGEVTPSGALTGAAIAEGSLRVHSLSNGMDEAEERETYSEERFQGWLGELDGGTE